MTVSNRVVRGQSSPNTQGSGAQQETPVTDSAIARLKANPGAHKSLVPLNERLWAIVVVQAKAKYHVWPSPVASKWAHNKYRQLGGRFRVTGEESPEDRRKKKKEEEEKKTQKQKEDEKKEERDKKVRRRRTRSA